MRISLTNLVNQLFLKKNHCDIFTKLIFFNKSLNPSFCGKIENINESFLVPNIEIFEALNNLFNKIAHQKNESDLIHYSHFAYIENLVFLSFIESDFSENQDEESIEFDEIKAKIKLVTEKFKNEFLEFFDENFEEQNSWSQNFLSNFRNFQFENDLGDGFDYENNNEKFYSEYLIKIAQIIFSDYAFGINKEKSEEIKFGFEKILFDNRILDEINENSDEYENEKEIAFMQNIFWQPYSKLLKLRKVFDSELLSNGPKNEALVTQIILLASQFGLYEAKYSAEFILKLINNQINLHETEKNQLLANEMTLLIHSKKILDGYIKALKIAKWDNGILYICEKIGLETEENFDQTEKLFRLLNLESVKILEIEKHPSADSLNLCLLSNGKKVVCGASNVHFIKNNSSYSTLYAPLGSFLPNDMIIAPREIRGVISKGMLCSLEELGSDCSFFEHQDMESLADSSEIRINKEKNSSGIIVLTDKPIINQFNEEDENYSYIGKYFSMHSWADLSVTPNLGFLLGQENLSKEIENFLKFNEDDEDYEFSSKKKYEEYIKKNKEDSIKKINPLKNFNFEYISGIEDFNLNEFESMIMVSEEAMHFFENIFFFKTQESKIKFGPNEINLLSVYNPGFDFKKETKINSLIKFCAGLYGIQLHAIRKNSLKDRIIIKLAMKNQNLEIHPKDFENSCSEIKVCQGDLCAFDMNEKIVFIPGVTNSKENCASIKSEVHEDQSGEIIFIGFLFKKNIEKNLNSYTNQIKLAQREKINNKLTHFYQRQSSFDLENFLNSINQNKKNNSISIKNIDSLNHQFKEIQFDIKDLLVLFSKDSKLIIGIMEKIQRTLKFQEELSEIIFDFDDEKNHEKTQSSQMINDLYKKDYEKISSFFENIYSNFVKSEFSSLGFKIIEKDNELENDNLYIKNVLVPKFRSDINSSIDIVGALYKILNFNCKISLTNDHISAFFEEIEDSSVQSYDFLKKKHDDINQYDENSLFNSFEIQKETQNIQLLHDGENNLNQIFYEAFKKLSYLGFGEVLHFSFIDDSKLQKFFDQKNIIKLKSAINKTLISLRPNLFVGLLEKYKEIIKTKKDESILLFEHGPIFWKENPFSKVITGVMGGKKFEKNPHLPVSYFSENNFFDFFDAKSSLLSALESLNLKEENLEFFPLDEFYQEKKKFSEFHKLLIEKKIVTNEGLDLHEKFLHPLRCAIIFAKIHEKKNSLIKYIFIGYCGEFNPFFLEEFDLNDEGHDKIANFVIFKDALEEIYLEKESLKYELFRSDFQAIQRDFALIFDENISISMIKNNIMENSKSHPKLQNIIHDLKIFDIFQNDELAKQNKKSVGFSFKICSNVKTFKDQEVKEITTIILEKIKLELGGVFAFEM